MQEFMPKIKARIKKQGNSYAFFVPKALIESKVLKENQEYQVIIEAINGGVFQSNFSYINITNNNVGVAL